MWFSKIDPTKDYYGVLCLAGTADKKAIQAAYYKQSLLVHPDESGGSASTESFNEVKEASIILRDDKLRGRYLERRDRHTLQRVYGTSVRSYINEIESELPASFRAREPAPYAFKPEICEHLAWIRRIRVNMGLRYSYALTVYLREFRVEVRPSLALKAPASPPATPPASPPTAPATPVPTSPPAAPSAPISAPPPTVAVIAPPATPSTSPPAISPATPPSSCKQTPESKKRRRSSDVESAPESLTRRTEGSKRTTKTVQPQRDAKTKYDDRVRKRKLTVQAKNRDQTLLSREQTKEFAALQPAPARGSHKKRRNKWAKKQERKRRGSESSWDGNWTPGDSFACWLEE